MKKVLLIFVFLLALGGGFWLYYELNTPYRGYSEAQLLVIEPGFQARKVSTLLRERGVLAHRLPFLLRYWVGRPRRHLKAGEYLFDRPLRPLDVYRKLVQGDIYLHTVVVPEGSDQFDIARVLSQQVGINPEDFLRVARESSAVRDLDPQAPSLEGFLFPDTYRFPRGVTASTVAATMLTRFRHILDSKLGAERAQSPRQLHEAVTLASLIEKETPDPRERPIVAGVFAQRLEKHWPLECDPTVVYAARLNRHFIGHGDAPIRQSDLKFDSPYNTYRYAGLPPGPICNPGEASLRAAFNPVAGNFLFFVSNNHGGHLFAATLAEHQRNVSRYRREMAALRAVKPEAKDSQDLPASREQRGATGVTSSSTKSAEQQK